MLYDTKIILVPVDHSKQAYDAFFEAVAFAKTANAKIKLITVLSDESVEKNRKLRQPPMSQKMKQEFEEYCLQARERYHYDNVDYETFIGDAKRVILRLLREDPAIGLVVMGATGKNAVERIFVGSVAQYVVRHSPVPVLLVR